MEGGRPATGTTTKRRSPSALRRHIAARSSRASASGAVSASVSRVDATPHRLAGQGPYVEPVVSERIPGPVPSLSVVSRNDDENDLEHLLASPARMRSHVLHRLQAQGFVLKGAQIAPPDSGDKSGLRRLHSSAVAHRVARARGGLESREERLLRRMARGADLDPRAVRPRLVEVQRGSEEELLFRWATLHWSIPVSSGYGRRLRYVVVDEGHDDALMGVFGLADPVYSLGVRDRWIGWDSAQRRRSLHRVMDAFVLGSVPPYSALLGGKFVAIALTSDEVRRRFDSKYTARTSRISGDARVGGLALVTTSSALGRSSVYNRLRIQGRPVATSVGFTAGYGEFHFSDGLYDVVTEYARRHCVPTAKRSEWGSGFRNRREVVKKALQHMGLPADPLLRHGVRREVFVFPLGTGARRALSEDAPLESYALSVDDAWTEFRERWFLPRSNRRHDWRTWEPESWRLW